MAKRQRRPLVEQLEARIQFSVSAPFAHVQDTTSSTAVHASLSHAAKKAANTTFDNLLTQATTADAQFAATYPGDANHDYNVNFSDFTVISNNFGTATAAGTTAGDLNLDGKVDFADFTIVSNNFGKVYTQPSLVNPISVTSKGMTTFTQLNVTGTTGDDNVLVTQSGGNLNITANGQTTSYAANVGNIVIHAGTGNDSVTVDPSVNITTLLYGDDGNDTLINRTSAKATIVDIDSFANIVTGNGVNTSYWVNPADVVNASAIEIANTAVNRVTGFYQTSVGAVPRALNGPNLADPTDGGATHRLTNNSFWGTGPVINDINQGSIGDCYYLSSIASLANNTSLKFQNTGVDLGDGTYAVRFIRNGITTFVRVDGDISNNYYTQVGATGNMWGPIYEKAYAMFRTGASTYNSLNSGNPAIALRDFGFSAATMSATTAASTLLNTINAALSAGRPVLACTQAVAANAPVIGYHCYSVIGAWQDASGNVMIQLRNPWGFDGAGSDGNTGDGIQTFTYATFAANYNFLAYATS